MAGDQHHVGGIPFELLQQIQAAAVGQHEIDEQYVGTLIADFGARFLQRPRRTGHEAFALDEVGERR